MSDDQEIMFSGAAVPPTPARRWYLENKDPTYLVITCTKCKTAGVLNEVSFERAQGLAGGRLKCSVPTCQNATFSMAFQPLSEIMGWQGEGDE
jgi:hypothetical protein